MLPGIRLPESFSALALIHFSRPALDRGTPRVEVDFPRFPPFCNFDVFGRAAPKRKRPRCCITSPFKKLN